MRRQCVIVLSRGGSSASEEALKKTERTEPESAQTRALSVRLGGAEAMDTT